MNRRSFLSKSALALFGFAVLPPAKTYNRIWKATIVPRINPLYILAIYETSFIWDTDIGSGLMNWKTRKLNADYTLLLQPAMRSS